MREDLIRELQGVLEKYKIAATAQISAQLLSGVTEISADIRDLMLTVSGIERIISQKPVAVMAEPGGQETAVENESPPEMIKIAGAESVPGTEENVETDSGRIDGKREPGQDEECSSPAGARIIGGDGTLETADSQLFIEEREKLASEFVFDKYLLRASHYGVSASNEIELYIAPLAMTGGQDTRNVPIVVYAYCQGQGKTASSYDVIGDGRNMVIFDIGEFCLLCRGNYNAGGVFESFVVTTGTSANSGDRIEVISKTSGARERVKGNGHLKFKEEDTVYEIFPLHLNPEEMAEYICIKKGPEFLDYFAVANGTKVRIMDESREVIVSWSGDVFGAAVI